MLISAGTYAHVLYRVWTEGGFLVVLAKQIPFLSIKLLVVL